MVNIGIIGVGGIANSTHIPQILESNGGQLCAICDIDKKRLRQTGKKYHIPPELQFENYLDLIHCEKVDAVEICTPNYLHVKMAQDAIAAGKAVNVEKPLSVNFGEASKLNSFAANPTVPNMMCFSYRFMPAVRYAKEILDKGMLGKTISVNVEYLKSSAFSKDRRLEWRFIKNYAGTGVLGDLGVHLIDMAQLLIGEMKRVCATCGIVIKERPKEGSKELGAVETDDYCNFLVDFENGVTGTFSITRCAIGHNNTIKYQIFGTKGVISFDLTRTDILQVCLGEIDTESCGMHEIKVPKRFSISQEQMFIDLLNGKECSLLPTIADGLKCQKILDALLLSSENKQWVDLI